jgi:hypothetical protein
VQPDYCGACPLDVGKVGGSNSMGAMAFFQRWLLNSVIFYSPFLLYLAFSFTQINIYQFHKN